MGTGGVLGCGGWEPPEANPLKLDSKCRYVFLEFICLFWLVLAMEKLRKTSDTQKYLERSDGRNHWSKVPGFHAPWMDGINVDIANWKITMFNG